MATTDTGDGTTWVINPGDGTGDQAPIYVAAGQQGEFDHTFPGDEGASYTVTAKVYDDACCGGGDEDSPYDAGPADVSIIDAPISFDPADSAATTEGDSQDPIVLGTISDQDPSPDAGDYSGEIDWGDGAITPAVIDGNTVEGVHPYTDEGTYTANVSLQDEGGSSTGGSVEVFADDAPITVSASNPGTFVEGQDSGDVIVGQVTDQNPFSDGTDLRAAVDWGDGPPASDGTDTTQARLEPAGQPTGSGPVTFNIIASHAYNAYGTFNMGVSVTDVGGSSGSDSTSIDLPAPTINVGSVVLGPGETLEVPVSLSGQGVANQPLSIQGYDSNLIQAAWENGNNVTDANGNAKLLVTGVDVGQANLVVALANFADVQGAAPEPVNDNKLVLSGGVTVCSIGQAHTITATLTHPDGTPAPNQTLVTDESDLNDFLATAQGQTNAQGQVTISVQGHHVSEGEGDTLKVFEFNDIGAWDIVSVTVVPPTISIPDSLQMQFNNNDLNDPIPAPLTITVTDPTLGATPIAGTALTVALTEVSGTVGTFTAPQSAPPTDANGQSTITVTDVGAKPGDLGTLEVSLSDGSAVSNDCTLFLSGV